MTSPAVILAGALCLQAPYSAAFETASSPAALAPAQRRLLAPKPVVVRAGGEPVMRLWFRTTIPAEVRPGTPPTYRQVPPGTLVGAVEFPRAFTDYRRQKLPAGCYTLRFALQPQTGEHTDTSPHPEFLLLCAARDDRSPGGMEERRLIDVSSRVTGVAHPALLLLWPPAGPAGGTPVVHRGDGVWTVAVQCRVGKPGRGEPLWFHVTAAGFRRP